MADTLKKFCPSALCTANMSAVEPPPDLKIAAVAEVEVARTESPAGEKGVFCPIETWSPAVFSLTTTP